MNHKMLQRMVAMGMLGQTKTQRINNWQSGGNPIQVGGIKSAVWNNVGTAGNTYSFILPGYAIRQNCVITHVRVNVATLDGSAWKFKLFRWTGTTYHFLEERTFTPTATGSQLCVLSSPISANMADIPGMWIPANNTIRSGNPRLIVPRFVAYTDIVADNAFASTGSNQVHIEILGFRPYLAVTGDSIMEGHNNGGSSSATSWHGYLHDVSIAGVLTSPGGLATSEMPNQLLTRLANLRYQNCALGGQTFAWVAATGIVEAVASNPAVIQIHCGFNDALSGRAWALVEADLATIREAAPTQRLLIDEVLPSTNLDDTQSALVRTYNTNLAVWCAANGATLIPLHDAFGQTRVSTGALDDLATAYSQDGTHLNTDGVDYWASLVFPYL